MNICRHIIAVLVLTLVWSTFARSEELAKFESITIVTEATSTLFSAEVADTDDLRARGLMFRHLLPEDRAMLFDFGEPRPASMWMKNTYISLDMLFVREDGTIAAIAENTEPLSLQTISVQEPVLSVVELAAGTARRLGIKREDRVNHRIFKSEKQSTNVVP